LPPRIIVAPLARDTAAGWAAVPPVPVLVEPAGAKVCARATIRLAHDACRLWLDACVTDSAVTRKPELAPDSPRFWTQDHVELRFLLDPRHDLDQVQFIAVPGGRFWDNRGLWKQPGVVNCKDRRMAGGWAVRLGIPFEVLGVQPPSPGSTWRGLVAHTRWADGVPDIVCSSAVELGFSQADRFGEFCFTRETFAVQLAQVTPAVLTLVNRARIPLDGCLRILSERGPGGAADTRLVRCRLAPGANRLRVALDPAHPCSTRFGFSFDADGRSLDLGAVSLRGTLPALRMHRLAHPYLLFDGADLPGIRARVRQAPFSALAKEIQVTASDLSGRDLPGPEDPVSLAIDKESMHWFRVAKETMVRDGEGNRRPAARHLWTLQSEAAREAWHGVVKSVAPTEEQLRTLIAEINGLLARRDFFDATAFADVALPEEGRRLLARGLRRLSDEEMFRFNRIVLKGAVECIHGYRMDLVTRPGDLWRKWLLTGNPRLIATATKAVRAALRLTIFDHQIHLDEGMAAGSLALAYDAFHPHLSRDDRKAWQDMLQRLLHLYVETASKRSWTVTTIANATPVGNGGCGLAALALWRECPALAAECLGYVRRYIRHWLDYCQGLDGGNTEGAQYWQYGCENFLRFAVALERVTGSDDGLLSHPSVRNAMNMIRVSLCNDGALHGVNDTIPMPIGAAMGWFLAGRRGDAFGLWYGDHALRWYAANDAAGKPTPYRPDIAEMLLLRPDVPECRAQPPLPEAFALKSIHYGILRSGPGFDCRWTAGLKGSRPPYTHHNQADTGAVFVDLRGERLLIDPGYHKPAPTDHTLPLIGGRGPVEPQGWTGAIVACEQRGAFRYLAVDTTAAYRGAATRLIRHLVMAGEDGMVLLDDIVADGDVAAQYQCGGVTTLAGAGRAVMVSGARARLRVDLATRTDAVLELKPERSLHDTHWGYHFADCRLFPVAATYQAEEMNPLVAVFLDATEGDPPASRVERSGAELTVRLPSGRAVRFAHHGGCWRLKTE